ncbi:chitin synthase chs-2-like [Bacillus rossius redtenbacheri]|uniref:chitin synthase chs-2-like n=1 Tax=Bacillus rossius redtenbacheri TaxID=93214 RepID=UPI002FDF0221
MWVTAHLWDPQADALASTDKLFVTPLYNSLLVDQSVAMNRKRNDKDVSVRREDLGEISKENDMLDDDEIMDEEHAVKSNVEFMTQTLQSPHVKPMDYVTRLYACATMWHETYDEMTCMIKSLLRLDVDQAIRKFLQKDLDLVDPNYYEFETHILFDDAFETKKGDDAGERVVNKWVKEFMKCMEDTVERFHGVRLQPPTTIPTPYGGRLVWTLPGRNKIVVHLKDKNKIRTRKRWSQVMYMYYLLGHRIMELPIHIDRKAVIAQNTYILAMDGDIDFQPQAVHLLIDLMKKNDTLGSSCGRIHPIGAGAMAWYQKFEYAIGHWLQKATEHMIGCVLCSPGAFSLFRARALMDQGVMKRYTFTATEPRHYVQFDQGEDRWLCTLLLQQGYRVEYSAASDAYTHCPESFDEFYNQRRRWVPSTMANIFDLLASYKQTIKINDNISAPYIFYHVVMMAGSILGPGTIFLMLVGAFVSAFKIGNFASMQYNLLPVIIFLFCCGVFSAKVQLFVAMVISSLYGLVMMAVVVGIAIQIQQDGLTAPSSIFFFMFLGELVIAALLHPKEIGCLPAILIYYVTVPSMYMLLIIFALFNMNNITWGTRDSPTAAQPGKTKKQLEEEKKAQEELMKNKKKNPVLGFLQRDGQDSAEDGSIEFSVAGLFRCMCCTRPKAADDQQQLQRIAESLDGLGKKLDSLERRMNPAPIPPRHRNSININGQIRELNDDPEDHEASDSESFDGLSAVKREDHINPYWISALDVKGNVHFLSDVEQIFWNELIDKYLFPLDENKEEKAKTEKALKELRNKCVFAFLMLNALFVLVIFLLQLNQDTIHLHWPLGVTNTISFNSTANEVQIVKTYLTLEPIGILFVAFFAVVLVVQFVGMLMHRFSTLSHLLASTRVSCGSKDALDMNEGIITEELVNFTKEFKLDDVNNPNDDRKKSTVENARRSTIHNLIPRNQQEMIAETIDAGLTHALDHIEKFAEKRKFTARRDTLSKLAARRSTVTTRRQSQMAAMRASQMSVASQLRASQVSAKPGRQVGFVNRAFDPDPRDLV